VTAVSARQIVPEEVIGPPVSPVPVATHVTKPEVGETHSRPVEHAEFAVRTKPFAPTGSADGVLAAVAVRTLPFADSTEGAMTQAELRSIVPVVVIVPPVKPDPVEIEVTVPLVMGPEDAAVIRP
jgi:hypothetical protein